MIGINGQGTATDVDAFVAHFGITFTILRDRSPWVTKHYGIRYWSQFWLLDKLGNARTDQEPAAEDPSVIGGGRSRPVGVSTLCRVECRRSGVVDRTAATRIKKFLDDRPGVPLTVAVGYSSVPGIAWLARRTGDRRVRLLIGDCRPKYFKHAKAEDRAEAVAFLERSDVVVQNWYKKRGGASEAHLKVWVAHDFPRPAVLSGSANLTHQGLYRNTEMVAEIAAGEVDEAVEQVEDLFAKAWDVKDRLLDYITPPLSDHDNDVDLDIPEWEPRRPPLLWWPGSVAWWVIGTLGLVALVVVLLLLLKSLFCGQAQWFCDAIRDGFSGG